METKEKIKQLYQEGLNYGYDFVKMVKPMKEIHQIRKDMGEDGWEKLSKEYFKDGSVRKLFGNIGPGSPYALMLFFNLEDEPKILEKYPQMAKHIDNWRKAKQMLKEDS